MRITSKISLRMRITLLTGLITFVSLLILTFASIENASASIQNAGEQILTVVYTDNKEANVLKPEGEVTVALAEPYIITEGEEREVSGIVHYDKEAIKASTLSYSIDMPVIEAKKSFNKLSYIYMAVLSITGMAVAYFVSGRALKPVNELNIAILRITENNLKERLPEKETKDEIGCLTESFNLMLDRLEEYFWRQKRFSSNVAHELKTPLATIKAGIQVLDLDKNPSTEEYKQVVKITGRNIERLINLVDDLMTLTNEGYDEQQDMISIDAVILDIIGEIKPLYEDKGLQVSYQTHEEECYIYGNEGMIYRVFYNLIENAMKYNIQNGSIDIKALLESNGVRVIISDTGMGIPNGELSNIFEPFYCVNSSRSRKLGGAGLGLSIVKSIVDRHGWTIDVESQEDQGTTFEVFI